MEANTIAINPLHTHDCVHCVFLGAYDHNGHAHDLYYCGTHEDGTVIARYGSDGPEYASGIVFAERGVEPYAEALKRAVERGLYNPKEQPLRWPWSSDVVNAVCAHDRIMSALAHVDVLLSDEAKELLIHKLQEHVDSSISGRDDLSEVLTALISYLSNE